MKKFSLTKLIKTRGAMPLLTLLPLLFSSCAYQVEATKNNASTPSEKTTSTTTSSEVSFDKEKIKKTFEESLLDGVSFTVDNGYLNLGGDNNKVYFNNAEIKLKIEALSLNGLSISLNLPIEYRGKSRQANITKTSSYLYLDLENKNNPASTDFKYRVNLDEYTVKEDGKDKVDASTGGTYIYKYGKLSFVLDEVLSILGIDNSINLDQGNTKFDIGAIISSLDELEYIDTSISPTYYKWNLPLGDKIVPIGLRGDNDNIFSGLDLPCLGEDEYKINDKASVKFNCSLQNEDISIVAPSNEAEYQELEDSLELIKDIAYIANKKKFTIKSDESKLKLTHYEEEIPGTSTSFSRPEINETAYISFRGDIDFSNNVLNDMFAKAIFECNGKGQEIAIEKNNDDLYINFNNILQAKTNKPVLDRLIKNIKDAFSSKSEKPGENLDTSSSGILTSIGAISDAIDAVIDSPIMVGIKENRYDDFLTFITSLKSSPNQIDMELNLSMISGTENAGTISLSLSRTPASLALLRIGFNKAKFASFTLEGNIYLDGFELSSLENKDKFVELYHLEPIADSFLNFSNTNRSKMKLKGYVLDEGTTSVYTESYASTHLEETYGLTEQGFTFDADFAFDLKQAMGSGVLNIVDRKEKFINDHQLKIDVEGKEKEGESDLSSALETNVNSMLVEYNSKNKIDPKSNDGKATNRKDPSNTTPIKAAFSIHSLNGLMSTLSSLLGSTDPRFERLTNLFNIVSNVGIIKLLSYGKYLELLATSVLKDEGGASINENEATFVIKKDILLNTKDLVIKLFFDNKQETFDEDGNSKINYGTINAIQIDSTFNFSSGDPSKNKKVHLEISSISSNVSDAELQRNFASEGKSKFADYSSVKTLLEFMLDSITLGSNEATNYTSTYHLKGTASVKFGIIDALPIKFDFYISLRGAEVKVIGGLEMGMLVGLNTKASGGDRFTYFYYHTNGENSKGTVYYQRWDDNNWPWENILYEGKISGEVFADNMMGYLLGNMLGMDDKIMNSVTSTSTAANAAIHAEDVLKKYSSNINASNPDSLKNPTFSIGMDLGKLANTSMVGNLEADINGKTLNDNKKTLYSASGKIPLVGGLLKATFSLTLDNVSSGNYEAVWDNNHSMNVVTNWKGTSIKKENRPVVDYFNYFEEKASAATSDAVVKNY
mgnify:FL=1